MRVAPSIELTESEIKILRTWSRGGKTPARLMKRAKIVLLAGQGERNEVIAESLGIHRHQVSRWRRRFVARGLAGIEKDLPRAGRKPSKREQVTALIIETTTQPSRPPLLTGAFGGWRRSWESTNRWCIECGAPVV